MKTLKMESYIFKKRFFLSCPFSSRMHCWVSEVSVIEVGYSLIVFVKLFTYIAAKKKKEKKKSQKGGSSNLHVLLSQKICIFKQKKLFNIKMFYIYLQLNWFAFSWKFQEYLF